jgi:hypothetical protein
VPDVFTASRITWTGTRRASRRRDARQRSGKDGEERIMTGIDNTAAAMPDGARLLALHLATVSGTLEEISTTWRRAWLTRPELPLRLPLRLQDTARQLTADIRGPR